MKKTSILVFLFSITIFGLWKIQSLLIGSNLLVRSSSDNDSVQAVSAYSSQSSAHFNYDLSYGSEEHNEIPSVIVSSRSDHVVFSEVNTKDNFDGELCKLLKCEKNQNYGFFKFNYELFKDIGIGDELTLPIPGSVDIDVEIKSISTQDGVSSVTGHLAGYPEYYYFGLTFDGYGNVYGEITSEKGNYAIRTYTNKVVIYEVVVDPLQFERDDF